MKSLPFDQYAAFIGLDWADRKHDICLQAAGSPRRELSVIEHSPQAIDDWALGLLKRFGDRPIALSCELKKGPLINALAKYPQLVVFPLNPASVAKYRETFASSGAKDDPADAELQCDLLQRHFERFKPLLPDSPEMRALQQLVEYRRSCVADRVRITNRITSALKNYYPQPLQWFDDKATQLFCDFLGRWPSLASLRKVRTATLQKFFHAHNVRQSSVIEKRIARIRSATPLTEDRGALHANQIVLETQLAQLQVLLDSIKRLDADIANLCKNHSDYNIFASFPGAGPVYSARLMSAFGDNRQRYSEAKQIQTYGGVAPVLKRSGNSSWVHWRYAAPTFLRQTFVEWAGESVRYSFWANAYYKQQKQRGKSHQTIIRALAYKWIRIMFQCWKNKQCYDESKYLNALKAKGSPLLQFAVSDA
jgi:transposase